MKGRAKYQRGGSSRRSCRRRSLLRRLQPLWCEIASTGFGKKWQNALRVDAYPKSGTSINAAAHVYHKTPYAWVSEEGTKISGKPLLWLPLPHAAKKIGRKKLTPQTSLGELHSVNRLGKPPLLMARIRVSKAARADRRHRS